jgi:hypothetical protein
MPDPEPPMIVTCAYCGCEYDGNESMDCPNCGSGNLSYDPTGLPGDGPF